MNAMWFKLFSQLYCGGVADGRMDRDNGARLCIRRQLGDDLAHLRVIEDGHTDDVGSRNVGHTVGQVRAGFGQRRHCAGTDVVHRQTARPVDQPVGHGCAHFAEADVAKLDVVVGPVAAPHDRITCPPSTLKICPVIHDASSDNRNRHIPTRSSGVPIRDSGSPLTISSTISLGGVVRLASVSMGPGGYALIRMFWPPSSRDSCWVKPLRPTLARP